MDRIEEETREDMMRNGFDPDDDDSCKDYCDWIDGYIERLTIKDD